MSGHSKEFCNSIHPKVDGDGCMVDLRSFAKTESPDGATAMWQFAVPIHLEQVAGIAVSESERRVAPDPQEGSRTWECPGSCSMRDQMNGQTHLHTHDAPVIDGGALARTRYHEQWIGGVVLLIR